MIFATANSKGGVGKSTIATHFAVWLRENGINACLVDSDVQSSSIKWVQEIESEFPVCRLVAPDDVLEKVPQLSEDYEAVVIDGPAGLAEVTRAAMLVSDVALFPCGPSILDLRSANEAIRVLRQAQQIRQGRPRALLVPNKLQRHYRLSRELLEAVGSLGIEVTSGLGLRQAFADCAGQGTVVWRMGARAKEASYEMICLFKEVIDYAKAEINE